MPSAHDLRSSARHQISDLQDQIESLRSSLASHGADYYDSADEHARVALRKVREQARTMGHVARENPASTATVLSIVALTCLGLGYIAGRAVSDDSRW